MLLVLSWVQALAQRLDSGDAIRLASASEVELNGDFTIGADGCLMLPRKRVVVAGGREESEVFPAIKQQLRLGGFVVADLQIGRGRSSVNRVSFAGALRFPGTLAFRRGLRLGDVLAIAEPAPGADLGAIQIVGADGEKSSHSIAQGQTGIGALIPLRPGDSIFVPLATKASDISVLGEVESPGKVDFFPGITALKAVGLAGGLTGNARTDSVEVLRDGLRVGLANAELNYDIDLKRGDTVRAIPIANPQYIFVSGAVAKPGRIAFRKGMRLTEALKQTEGPHPLLASGEIIIRRRVNGSLKTMKCSMERILKRLEPNLNLEPSDIVDVQYRSIRSRP